MRLVLSLIISIALLSATQAWAGGWPWAKLSYAHYAENEPIRELLQQFASAINTPIVISEDVQGVVNGNFEEALAKDFIDQLAKMHSLLWYYDGQVLYVYDTSEVETDLIHLQDVSSRRLVNTLTDLGVLDWRFTLRAIPGEGIVMVSGPPRYTQLVGEVAEILLSGQQRQAHGGDKFIVKVFELKHAWADDRTMVVDGQRIPLTGVASSLQAVLGRQIPEKTTTTIASRTVPKLKGQGLAKGRYGAEESGQGDSALIAPQVRGAIWRARLYGLCCGKRTPERGHCARPPVNDAVVPGTNRFIGPAQKPD
ncbi:secretin N-terminal domain-containing protein [Hahella ganghwensis]|uniref:secretin N-terminal domain-containing protein n=1 Tax=Hahella ganghwensis TaxID=286420 RepID=UPI0003A25B5E|nr:secretin N-terminal domain-containing protein [Hahella ganghwensis]